MNGVGNNNRPLDEQAGNTLSKQLFDTIDGDGLSGEQRLMLAVLIDAINVLKGRIPTAGYSKRQMFAEAAHWVAQEGTHYPFTFDSVCAALDLPGDVLRQRLLKLARSRGESSSVRENRIRRLPTSRAGAIRFTAPHAAHSSATNRP
jgi:hypothetical protein